MIEMQKYKSGHAEVFQEIISNTAPDYFSRLGSKLGSGLVGIIQQAGEATTKVLRASPQFSWEVGVKFAQGIATYHFIPTAIRKVSKANIPPEPSLSAVTKLMSYSVGVSTVPLYSLCIAFDKPEYLTLPLITNLSSLAYEHLYRPAAEKVAERKAQREFELRIEKFGPFLI